MLSYWEKKELKRRFDLLVVGGGITGYSAAIEFKSYRPDLRVGVLERSSFETTASSKNAGFACFGSITEMLSDLRILGEEAFLELVSKRWKGLRILRQRVGDKAMEFNECGGYEVFTDEASFKKASEAIPKLNAMLRNIVGTEVFHSVEHAMHFQFRDICGLIHNRYEGQLDPAKMLASIKAVARSLDIEEIRAEVVGVSERNEEVQVDVSFGYLRASQVIVATNGLASGLLDLDVKPARAQVLITEPIDELGWSGVFHMEEGYYYFRNVGDRVLLGGGRNLDFNAEETFSQETTDLIQDKLESLLRKHILPNRDFVISDRWAGTMGVGEVKAPIVARVSERIIAAVRLGGMGVAIGSLVGQEAADLCL
jgi:glycine/D-amino acid oxidase-like deaminating enzyme